VRLRRSTATSQADEEAELVTAYRLLEVARARRYFQGANTPEVIGRAKELAERLQRRHVLLDMLWFEWSALATSDRVDEAKELAQSYVALTCNDPDPTVRAMGVEVAGVACWTEGRIAEAVERFDEAMALIDWRAAPRTPFDAEKRMIVRVFWLWNRVLAGRVAPDDAFADFHSLTVDQPDRFVVSSVCGFAATTAVTIGDWDQVQRFVDINHDADPGSQFAFWGGQTMMLAALADARSRDVDDAMATFAEGKRRYIEIGARSALATYEASLAMLVAARGRLDDAARLVAAARTELDTYRAKWNAAIVRLAEASVRHACGDLPAAVELFEDAHAIAVAQGAHALAERVRSSLQERDLAR
jgi:tetratricopeptide (TPR) repeat protein